MFFFDPGVYFMEVRIERSVFFNSVQRVQGVVETKGAMPILSHVLISAETGQIQVQSTNLEIGILGNYPANVETPGAVCLNAKKLFDILRELPDQEVHLKTEENHWATLKCGKSKFRLPGLAPEEFPPLPEYDQEALIEFTGKLLKEMINKTQFAVSPDETRQALNSLLLEENNGQACMVGTDGHRLAMVKRTLGEPKDGEGEAQSFLLPRKAITELLKLMEDEDISFKFSVRGNHLAFIHGNHVIVARKIDGKFPNFRQVIPKENDLQVHFKKDDLIHALKRVALLADEKSRMVRFEVSEGTLALVSDNSEMGTANEEISANYSGDEIRIGLNAKYVLDVLSAMENEEVTFNLKDSQHSCLITDPKDGDFLSIVMPMRL